jgi:ABC-type glutathione transport system ATPase component
MLLEVNNLSISYGPKKLFSGFNLTVDRHETVGLVGPSGCGKSSFIHALVGSLNKLGGKVSGEIILLGNNLLKLEDERLLPGWDKMALVPQASMNSFNPSQKMKTVFDEALKFTGNHATTNSREHVYELLELVQLPSRVLNQYPHELSGGMKQRLAIALAFFFTPDLIIFDEATTGLDVLVEADILFTIRGIQKKTQTGFLMVSHDFRIIQACCHKAVNLL